MLAAWAATTLWLQMPVREDVGVPGPQNSSEPVPSKSFEQGKGLVLNAPSFEPDTSGICGQVVCAGTPMPDMRVYIDWEPYEGPCVYSGVTDGQGTFATPVPAAGKYRVLAADAKHVGQIAVTWPEDQGAMPLIVEVGEQGQVSGRTVDKYGQPVPYATVRISQEGRTFAPPVQSDNQGCFSTGFPWRTAMFWAYDEILFCATQGDQAGSYILFPEDPRHSRIYQSYLRERCEEVLQPEPMHLDDIVVSLDTACTLAGYVRNQRNDPMPHVCVAAMAGDTPWPVDTETDESGAFVLAGVPPGHYTFQAYKSSTEHCELMMSEVNFPVVVAAGECIEGIEVRVSVPEEVLRGRVIDPMGRPVEGAEVRVEIRSRLEIPGDGRCPQLTDAHGAFCMDRLYDGDYLLKVTREGYVDYLSPSPVAVPGQNISVALVPKPSIHGRVLDGETAAPIKDARLNIFPEVEQGRESKPLLALSTDDEPCGEFTFELPDTGGFVLQAIADGYEAAELPFTAAPGAFLDDVTVTMSPAEAASGFLADAKGEPVSASLSFTQPAFMAMINTHTGDDGGFTVDGLIPGPGTVLVGIGMNLEYTLPFDYVPGEEIELLLPPGGTIRGTVSRNGEPIKAGDAMLYCPEHTRSKEFDNFETEMVDGVFLFQDVPAGNHMIEIREDTGQDSHVQEVRVIAGMDTVVNIEIPSGAGSIEGLLTLNGIPCKHSCVIVKIASKSPMIEQTMFSGFPDRDGHYRIEGLPAGRAELQGSVTLSRGEGESNAYCSRQFPVTVPESGVTWQDIALTMRGVVLVTVDGMRSDEHLYVFALTKDTTLEQLGYLLNTPHSPIEMLDARRLPRGQAFVRLDTLCPGTVRIGAIVTSSRNSIDYFPDAMTSIRQAETIITLPENISAEEVIKVNLCTE